MKKEFLLLFDSKCPMCCKYLQILDTLIDPKKIFIHLCHSASHYAKENQEFFNLKSQREIEFLDNEVKKTILLVDLSDGYIASRSTAIIQLFAYSKSNVLRKIRFFKIIPCILRDAIYRLVAKNRILLSRLIGIETICKLSLSNIKVYKEK